MYTDFENNTCFLLKNLENQQGINTTLKKWKAMEGEKVIEFPLSVGISLWTQNSEEDTLPLLKNSINNGINGQHNPYGLWGHTNHSMSVRI